jgi:hypothetical protein
MNVHPYTCQCGRCGKPLNPEEFEVDWAWKWPEEVARMSSEQRAKKVKMAPDFLSIKGEKYWIRCIGYIPLLDPESPLGFGFWVEVSNKDFQRFRLHWDDSEYLSLEAWGILANPWPGFDGTLGQSVHITPLEQDKRPLVIEVPGHEINQFRDVGSATREQLREINERCMVQFGLRKRDA